VIYLLTIFHKNACNGRVLRFSKWRKWHTKAAHRYRRFFISNYNAMPIFINKKRVNPYSQIENAMINDIRLTQDCVGVMTYLLSRQNEHVSKSDLYERFNTDYFSIIDSIEMLKVCGYIDSNEDYITIK